MSRLFRTHPVAPRFEFARRCVGKWVAVTDRYGMGCHGRAISVAHHTGGGSADVLVVRVPGHGDMAISLATIDRLRVTPWRPEADPDSGLRELRAALADYPDTARVEDVDAALVAADRVVAHVRALDRSLTAGGDLPADWEGGRT